MIPEKALRKNMKKCIFKDTVYRYNLHLSMSIKRQRFIDFLLALILS